jgi:hypothetical protein
MPVPEPYDSFGFWAEVKPYTEWPASDEDAVRTLARAWLDAGAAFTAGGNSAGDNLEDGWTDSVGQDYKQTVDQLRADSGAAGAGMTFQGNLTEAYADDVLNAKLKIAAHIQRYAPIYSRLSFWADAAGAADAVRFVENEAAIINTFLDRIASAIAARGAGGPTQPKRPADLTVADDPDAYVPVVPLAKDDIGAVREETVAELVGGTVLGEPGGPGLIVRGYDGTRWNETDVDVIGPDGRFIAVGGMNKEKEQREGTLAVKLTVLQDAAVKQGTHAEAWFTRDTPPVVIEEARGILGPGNVYLFDA